MKAETMTGTWTVTDTCLKILLVEDEPAHAEAIRRAFQASRVRAELQVTETLRGYRDHIRTNTPDIAILDLDLPDGRALEVLTSPAEMGRFPVLIITSLGDQQIAVEAMKAGALDYIVKSPEAFTTMPQIVERSLREWKLLRAGIQDGERIVHLNSVLRGIRKVNQLITRGKERLPLLQDACELLVETLGYRTAWIAVRQDDDKLVLGARAGMSAELASRLSEQLEQGSVPSCVGSAMKQQGVLAQSLPRDECRDCAVDGAYPHCGVFSARMEHRDVVYGVMVAAIPEAFVFDEEEQTLFQEVVGELSFAQFRLGLEGQHQIAADAHVRSEARYRDLVENIEDIVFSMALDGRIRYVSPAVERIYGYPPEDVVGHHFQDFVHPEDLPGLSEAFQRTLQGIVEPYEFRSVDRQGTIHHLRSTSRPRLEGGVPTGVNGVLIDISELHQALVAERRSAERWQATFDAISDIVCVVSNDHRVVEMNQAGCRALSKTRDEVIGQQCFELIHGTDSPIIACPCKETGQSMSPTTARYEQHGRTYDLLAWPIPGDDDQPNGFVHIVKDVTGEVEAAKEKEKLEEQLKLSQRLEALGRLAGGVAHDFNNLLSVIISYAGFVAEELRESDPIYADVVEIQSAGRRAATLTRQLLAFSRKQLLEPEVLSLNRVVSGIESMLRRLLGEDIDIEVHLAEGLDSVMADPGQMEQVIMNLAVNARDAMPHGGKLTIETANVALDEDYAERHVAVKAGRFVMLSVTDTGAGIGAETKAQVFDPFFTTKEKGKGTGLGLSTVYGIVKQSGGNIWVYSEPGRGATFKVYLPRVDAAAVEVRRRPTTAVATGSETVLVVEDEDAVRRLAERILRSAGYRVHSAASGRDALALFEDLGEAIDLLLTDVVMPQMSGRELAERLAKLLPTLKVLYMSGYTDNAIVHHGVLDPGTRFIGKPFAAVDLARKVREVLDEEMDT